MAKNNSTLEANPAVGIRGCVIFRRVNNLKILLKSLSTLESILSELLTFYIVQFEEIKFI